MTKLKDLDLLALGNTINLAGAIYAGEGKTFLAFFPEDRNDLPLEPLELDLEDWNALVRQTDILETEVLSRASDGTLAKIIVRKSTRHIDNAVSWRVFKRDRYACRYCGNDNTPLTVDHLVTWEDGGPSTEANLISSCKKCNKIRGNTLYSDWLNHPRYRSLSANLHPDVVRANSDLVATLDKIPRNLHKPSR